MSFAQSLLISNVISTLSKRYFTDEKSRELSPWCFPKCFYRRDVIFFWLARKVLRWRCWRWGIQTWGSCSRERIKLSSNRRATMRVKWMSTISSTRVSRRFPSNVNQFAHVIEVLWLPTSEYFWGIEYLFFHWFLHHLNIVSHT